MSELGLKELTEKNGLGLAPAVFTAFRYFAGIISAIFLLIANFPVYALNDSYVNVEKVNNNI